MHTPITVFNLFFFNRYLTPAPVDKSRSRPQKGPSGAFPLSGNRLYRAAHRASTSLVPFGLPAPCQARHQASRIVTSPTCIPLISAPQRGVNGATAPTAPRREPKNAPAGAGENSPRGNCVPPCRATASPSHRTRPPLWACGPPIRLKAVGSPLLAIQKRRLESAPLRSGKGKQVPRLARRSKARRLELRPGVRAGPARLRGLCGLLSGCHFRAHTPV